MMIKMVFHPFRKTICLLCLLMLCISACDSKMAPLEPLRITVDARTRRDNPRQTFFIGEPIMLGIRVENPAKVSRSIYGLEFKSYRPLFSPPNQLHLLAPDGTDLLLPYRCADCTFEPMLIEGEGTNGALIAIYLFTHLQQAGDYTFWVELMDSHSQLHRSNEFHFTLLAGKSTVPSEQIKLTLRPTKSSFTLTESWDVEATLTNHADIPLTFLKPQEGSFYGWNNPMYLFSATDERGRHLAFPLTDGASLPLFYDQSTQFTIAPSDSFTQRLTILGFPDMRKPGTYQVRLTYIVREHHLDRGTVTDKPMNWTDDVFVGVIESNEITIQIE